MADAGEPPVPKPVKKTRTLRRRRHERYGKNGHVTVHLALSYPGLAGSLFDIGIGGCLVWMDAEAPYLPGDVVEVRLTCDTLNFRVLGSIRHTDYHGRTLGIQFHRLNPRDTAELETLLQKLEEAAENEPPLTF